MRRQRRNDIMDLTVEILIERGYRDTTMLEVAKRASASKETLYSWFGGKRGLFEAIIRRNAHVVQKEIVANMDSNADIKSVLVDVGMVLLRVLLGNSAIAINRAAISEVRSDPSLAETLVNSGRDETLSVFVKLFESRKERGEINIEDTQLVVEDFIGMLLGDLQLRRLLGQISAPTSSQIIQRATHTANVFLSLYPIEQTKRHSLG